MRQLIFGLIISLLPAIASAQVGFSSFGTVTAPAGPVSPPPGPGIDASPFPFIVTGAADTAGEDSNSGVLYVGKAATYSGAPTGLKPAIAGVVSVGNGVASNQTGLLGSIYNSNTQASQPNGTASGVAVTGTAWCLVVGCSAVWGGLLAGYDVSGQVNPPNSLTGLEVDNYAHGSDNHQVRVGLQIAVGTPDGQGPANEVAHGLMISGSPLGYYRNLFEVSPGTQTINGLVMNTVIPRDPSGHAILTPGFGVNWGGWVAAIGYVVGSGSSAVAGATCHGPPTTQYQVTNGLVTHC